MKMNLKIQLHKNLNSYTYTFTRDEIVDYISANGYKRKILFLKCSENEFCDFYVNINTDKNKMEQKTLKEHYFIYNNSIHDLILSPPNYARLFPLEFLNPTYEIHLEKLSGDISLITNNTYTNYNNNYYVFPLESDNEFLNLKIESKNNSFYNIKYCYIFTEYNEFISYNKYIVPQSGNYMIKFNFEKGNKVVLDFYQSYLSFLNNFFYPIDCMVEIECGGHNFNQKRNITKYHSPDGTIFFHDLSLSGYYNIYSLNNEKSCTIYVSSYLVDTGNINSTENTIILKENSPQVFLLNNNNPIINYSYYFRELSSEINLKISLLNKGNFELYLYFNDILESILDINSSQIIKIDENQYKNSCDLGQICKFSYSIIKKDNSNNDYFIKININPLNKEDIEVKQNKNNGNKIYIILLFVLFALAGFIFLVCYKKINLCPIYSKKNNKPMIEMNEIEKDLNLIQDNKK